MMACIAAFRDGGAILFRLCLLGVQNLFCEHGRKKRPKGGGVQCLHSEP